MKHLLLLITTLLFISCSSDDSSNNPQGNGWNYKHVVYYGGTGTDELTVSGSHTYSNGQTGSFNRTFNQSFDRDTWIVDNSNNTTYQLTNSSSSDVIIQFEAYREDATTGTYLEPNGSNVPEENIEFWLISDGETITIIYDYGQQKFIRQ